MTDTAGPDGTSAPGAPYDSVPPAGALPSPAPSSAPTAAGKMRPVIIVGVLVALLAIILFAVRNNVKADDLKIGDCFNVPDGATIKTVEKHPCAESHNAEVIFIGEYTDGSSFPISLSLDRFVTESCVPAFETYVGRAIDSEPALSVGYFHPTLDGWNKGDRTITCYVTKPDESPTTGSVKS